jgi:hypothetical protein
VGILAMNFMQVISEFFAYKFPCWGVCQLSYEPTQKALYFHCATPGRRLAILRSAKEIAYLDIGIDKFIAVYPGYADIVIQYIPRRC